MSIQKQSAADATPRITTITCTQNNHSSGKEIKTKEKDDSVKTYPTVEKSQLKQLSLLEYQVVQQHVHTPGKP